MAKAKPHQKNNLDKLESALDKLDALESKPQSEFTLRESIYFLRHKLNSALKKGYNYQDLSEILAQQDILISAATLKQYLADIGKKSSSRKIRKSSTIVNSSKEAVDSSVSDTQSNRMKKETEVSIEAVSLNSTNKTFSSDLNKSPKVLDKNRSTSKKSNKSQAKPKVLSGFDDDLSNEFNSF